MRVVLLGWGVKKAGKEYVRGNWKGGVVVVVVVVAAVLVILVVGICVGGE